MSVQGFFNDGDDIYVYQETSGTGGIESSAIGIDDTANLFNIFVKTSSGATPTAGFQFQIDPSANGNITLNPNGTGELILNYATPNAVAVYGPSGSLSEVGPLTNGQLVIGSTGAPPVASSLTSSGGTLVITPGAGTINLDLSTEVEETAVHAWNGSLLETTRVTVTSNGTVITLSVEKDGGGDLTVVFSDGLYDWDTSPADTIALTAGSDSSPQINYVYFLQSTKALAISSSGWPATEYAPIATVLCQSAASLQTDGAYKVHVWTDHVISSNNQGHISDINLWIRQQSATWTSGVVPTLTIDSGPSPDTVIFTCTSGIIHQLHAHTFPAFSGTPDIYVVNDSVTPYKIVNDLNTLLTDSTGASMSGRYFSLVIFGIVSEDPSDCKLMLNLPGGSYFSSTTLASDANKFTDFTIPTDFNGTGFLIGQYNLRHQVGGGGQWTLEQFLDLRGLFPAKVGGTATAAVTEFADNTFRIFDEGDGTKELAFQASGITTATTRTITMADRDINLTNIVESFSTDSGSAVPSAGVITISGGQNVSTSGSGSTVTIDISGGLEWSVETGASVSGAIDTGYIANRAGLVTITLPTTAAVGSIIEVTGINTAVGWRIAQNAGETIYKEASATTTGVTGYLESTAIRDSVRIVCVVANTDWNVVSFTGTITVA